MTIAMNLPNAQTLEGYRGLSATNVGALFNRFIDIAAEEEDIFTQMEGAEDSDRPIWLKTDLTKGGADKVYFAAVASLGGNGVHGDEVLQGNEEPLYYNNYACQIDFIRHAVALTKKDIEFLAAGKSIEAAAAPLVAKWLGRKRQRDMMMRFRASAVPFNTLRPNQQSGRDSLTSADTLSTGVITQSKAVASTIGAKPVNIVKEGFSKVLEYLFLATEDALSSLSNSSTWLQAQHFAGTRGDENVIFKGGYTRWNGNTIVAHKVVDADTAGPIGSPLLPKALIGNAVTAGTSTFDITGGGITSPSTETNFFECFLGAPYRYLESDSSTSTDPGTYYVVVVNMSDANAGKWGFYSYTGSANNANKITITNRLAAAASGAAVTTLGGVTWDATKNTDSHPSGSLVLQANANGQPLGYSILMGAGAGLRAYGSIKHELVLNMQDYGHRLGWAYQTIYGQQVRKDSGATGTQNPRGYVLVEHVVSVSNAPMK
jgi:hypothetical protein